MAEKRKRSQSFTVDERNKLAKLVYAYRNIEECQGVNNKKDEIKDLKRTLLQEELEFKRCLYNLQLESAKKDLEIKIEVLNQIKGGNFNLKNLFDVPKDD